MTDISPPSVDDALARLAIEAARAGGVVLLRCWQGTAGLARRVGQEVKVDADRLADAAIVRQLGQVDLPIESEESDRASAAVESTRLRWVVDPLDGSHNFSRRIPFWSVSIALCAGLEVIYGVVHDPLHGEMFVGGIDHRARCLGQQGEGADTHPISLALSGIPRAAALRSDALDHVTDTVKANTRVRLLGSAALGLAYVAVGRADSFREIGLRWHDMAAGVGLARSAGCEVETRFIGGDPPQWEVTAQR